MFVRDRRWPQPGLPVRGPWFRGRMLFVLPNKQHKITEEMHSVYHLNKCADEVTEELVDLLVNAGITDIINVAERAKYTSPQDDGDLWWPSSDTSAGQHTHRASWLVQQVCRHHHQFTVITRHSQPSDSSPTSPPSRLIGPIPWGHSGPLSCVVVVVVRVAVDIDAQAAHDSTANDIWWIGVRRLVVANGPTFSNASCWAKVLLSLDIQIKFKIRFNSGNVAHKNSCTSIITDNKKIQHN